MLSKIFFFALSMFCINSIIISQTTWTGDGDGTDWADPDNWDTDMVPGSSDDVIMNFGTASLSDQQICKSLLLNDATLTINRFSSLTIRNFSGDGLHSSEGTLQINGILNIRDANLIGFNCSVGSFTAIGFNGKLSIQNLPIKKAIQNDGSFTNYGTVETQGGSVGLENTQDFVNIGSMSLMEHTEIGLENDGYGLFANGLGSIFNITNFDSDNEVSFLIKRTATNRGQINISNWKSGVGLSIEAVFTNELAGGIEVVASEPLIIKEAVEFSSLGMMTILVSE